MEGAQNCFARGSRVKSTLSVTSYCWCKSGHITYLLLYHLFFYDMNLQWKGLLCRGTHVHHPRLISHKSKRNPLKIGPPLQTGFELYEQSFCIPQPLICLRLLSPGCNIEDATSRENLCDLLKGQKFKTSSFQGHLYH